MKSFPFAIRALLSRPPDSAVVARAELDQMASEAARARMIRQAGMEAVRTELEK